MKSLKSQLYEAIKGAYPNMFSIERAEALAWQGNYKISNYERRARELVNADLIRPIFHEKGYIMGYLALNTPKTSPAGIQGEITKQENLFGVGAHSYKY